MQRIGYYVYKSFYRNIWFNYLQLEFWDRSISGYSNRSTAGHIYGIRDEHCKSYDNRGSLKYSNKDKLYNHQPVTDGSDKRNNSCMQKWSQSTDHFYRSSRNSSIYIHV